MADNNPTELPNLECSLNEINDLINKMESSGLTLEQSLNSFERGITLIKHCQKILAQAEQKVQILMRNNEQEELIPYGQEATDEAASENASNA